jgi:glycosyltransferase involved in cell wall biosynthesis
MAYNTLDNRPIRSISIGIDATNLRSGGGLTHLMELLRVAEPGLHQFERIIIWGSMSTLSALEDKCWLIKRNPQFLNRDLLFRIFWQKFYLSAAALDEGCDILFVPGGSFAGDFSPVVAMSQNLLPFELLELRRYGITLFALKLLLLRLTQSRSFIRSDGVMFLTNYARSAVSRVTGELKKAVAIVPHGLNQRFINQPKLQRNIADYNKTTPFRILYVSIIDHYKHQWFVVEAVADLRKRGYEVVLDLVGPAYLPALKRLNKAVRSFDPEGAWVFYHGAVPFDELHRYYEQADLGLFASSCENMPNILLETMASGLPIACSNRGPMPEMLGNGGVYFDPERPSETAYALLKLVESQHLRQELAQESYKRSLQFSWQRCASETFQFLNSITR